jgi:2,3-dihydroxyphenylpropionate 1,2-dioxygenase
MSSSYATEPVAAGQFLLTCVSHGPALATPLPQPAEHPQVIAAYDARAAALRAFDPQLIVIFAPDHYTNIHLDLVPPFCIGLRCEAMDDYGGFPGLLNVPSVLASDCAAWLREHDIDIAVSHSMHVDHGFSQPLHNVAGGVERYPVLPVCINTTCKPLSPFRRVRLLGKAVGEFCARLGLRVAFMASGGLSHHPANIFPQELGSAPEHVKQYLMSGGAEGAMKVADWHRYLGEQTVLGGRSVMEGRRTSRDFRINRAWDETFLSSYLAGDMSVFDKWDPTAVVEQAGVAAVEIQQWIAAASAALVCGVQSTVLDLHVTTVEYRLSVAVAHADPLPTVLEPQA